VIIYRAFYREAAQATAAIVVVLLVVLVFFGLTAVLGRAARGDFAQTIVLKLLGWQTAKRLDLLLPLGLYLGTLLTLSRWYRDSEMTVLSACGVGLRQLLRPVLVLALVVAVLVAGASFYLTPLANRQIELVKLQSERRPELAGIAPGTFTEAAAGGRILYAERVEEDGRLGHVFVASPIDAERPRVVLAAEGDPYIDAKTGDRFVVLKDGRGYEGKPGAASYRIVHFERYHVRITTRPLVPPPTRAQGMTASELLAAPDRAALAEWHWRLSKPLLVPILAAFALVLAHTDARRGRLANLFAAVLVYFIYSNLLGLGETLLRKGQVPGGLGLWWVHAPFALLAAYFLARRNANRPLFRWLPGRATA
jgi:lipopolysaccharide export system permease protein